MSELQEVIRRLPHLSKSELGEVRKRLQVLGVVDKAPGVDKDDWLLTGISEELRKRGVWAKGLTVPTEISKNYATKAKAVREHLLAGFAVPPARMAELMALGALAGQVLAQWLVRHKVPVRAKTMLDNVEKLPAALEDAFPNYWASRALGICLEKR